MHFNQDYLLNGFIFFLVLVIMIKLYVIDEENLVYLKSSVDEDFHLVQDLKDKNQAANLMAEIKERIDKLFAYLKRSYPNNPDVQRLMGNYNEDNVRETDIGDDDTSFSVDKGQELHLCLRDKKDFRLHQINILMFVTIHELAHLMSKTYGHNGEFNKNFVFLLRESVKLGIYTNIDYSRKQTEYCGMTVNSNPLF